MENAFAKPIDEVLKTFNVSTGTGLTDEQVSRSRATHGKNGEYNAALTLDHETLRVLSLESPSRNGCG